MFSFFFLFFCHSQILHEIINKRNSHCCNFKFYFVDNVQASPAIVPGYNKIIVAHKFPVLFDYSFFSFLKFFFIGVISRWTEGTHMKLENKGTLFCYKPKLDLAATSIFTIPVTLKYLSVILRISGYGIFYFGGYDIPWIFKFLRGYYDLYYFVLGKKKGGVMGYLLSPLLMRLSVDLHWILSFNQI